MPDLPVTIDSGYADDATHPDVKIHQMHHDALHGFYNFFELDDQATWPNGGIFFWNTSLQKMVCINPGISGSPGPQGIQGRGFRWLGDWDNATAYKTYNGTTQLASDVVTINGDTYVCLADNSNSQPPSANWDLFTAAGQDGTDGIDGAQGPDGPAGPPGPSAETLIVVPTSGGTLTCDVAAGSVQDVFLSTSCVITLAAPLTGVSALTLLLHQGSGGGSTPTFTNSIAWENATVPTWSTAANKTDIVTFMSVNGVWYGFTSAMNIASPSQLLTVDVMDIITSTGSATSWSTSSIDLDDGDMVIIGVNTLRSAGTPTVPTVSGGGLTTISQLGSQVVWNTGAQNKALTMFGGRQASMGAPAAIVFAHGGVTQTGMQAVICRVKGSKSTALTLANTKFFSNATNPVTSISVTLSAASDSDNRPIAFVVSNDGNLITPRANWTELDDRAITTPVSNSFEAQWRSGAFETTASGTKTAGGSGPMGIIATELEQG